MKIMLKYITVIALLLFIISCSKDDEIVNIPAPTSRFSFEAVTNSPQIISFINISENAENYEWNFGDNSEISFEKHPSHTYLSGGTYSVVLKSFNQDYETQSVQELTILGNPSADFSYQADSSISFKVNFQNLSQNTNTYTWDFGDGSETSNEENPSCIYASEGIYTVTLTSEGAGGNDVITKEIEVTDLLPPFSNLYLVGDGSPSGWDLISPASFTQDNSDPFIFTFEGLLTPGELKISTFAGDWCDGDWINPPNNGDDISGSNFIVTIGCDGPDNKWVVTSENQGRYKITVNLQNNTISFVEQLPEYSNLYIIGDASPSGYNIGAPEAFIQSDSEPFIFTFEGLLIPGELKISTFAGDWCDGDWINPPNNGDDISGSNFIVTNGCDGPDNKWVVTSENQGRYKITVNLQNNTISFVEQLPEYSNLYIIGDASPSGYNIGAPEAFTQSDSDAFEFTFEGLLTPGELKISTFAGDWCDGDWINPPNNGDDISGSNFIVTNGCDGPDNKWTVTPSTQGTYTITINLYHETIMFELQ